MRLIFKIILPSIILLWTASIHAQIKTVVQSGHDSPITETAISQDGKIMATTDGEVIIIWDIETGLQFKTLYIGEGLILPITNLQFIKGAPELTISFLYNLKIVYQSVENDGVLFIKKIKSKKKNHLMITKEEKLKIKIASCNNENKLNRYLKQLRNREDKIGERWNELKELQSYVNVIHLDSGYRLTQRMTKLPNKEYRNQKRKFKKISKYNRKNRNKPQLPNPEPKRNGDCSAIELFKGMNSKSDKIIYPNNMLTDVKTNIQYSTDIKKDLSVVLEGQYIYNLQYKNKRKDKLIVGKIELKDVQKWRQYQFSPNCSKLVSLGEKVDSSDVIAFWDANSFDLNRDKKNRKYYLDPITTPRLIHQITTHKVNSFEVSANSDFVICLHNDCSMSKWSIDEGKEDVPFRKGFIEFVSKYGVNKISSISMSTNGAILYLICSTIDNPQTRVILWEINSGVMAGELGARIPPAQLKPISLVNGTLTLQEWDPLKRTRPKLSSIMTLPKADKRTISLRSINFADFNSEIQIVTKSEFLSNSSSYSLAKNPNDVDVFLQKSDDFKSENILLQRSANFSNFIIADKGSIVMGIDSSKAYMWDIKTGALVNQIESPIFMEGANCNETNTNIIIYSRGDSIWNYNCRLNTFDKIPVPRKIIQSRKSKADRKIRKYFTGVIKSQDFSQILDIQKHKDIITEINKGDDHKYEPTFSKAKISPDGKRFVLWRGNGYEYFYYDYDDPKFEITDPDQCLNQNYLIKQTLIKAVQANIIDGESDENKKQIMLKIREEMSFEHNSFIDDSCRFIATNLSPFSRIRRIEVREMRSSKLKLMIREKTIPFGKPYISPSGKYLALSSNDPKFNIIRIWDIQSKQIFKTIIGHSGDIFISPDDHYLISGGSDRQIKIWDISQKDRIINDPVISYIGIRNSTDYIMYNNEGYYFATKTDSRCLGFEYNRKIYPFEQFDLTSNRPDIISKQLQKIDSLNIQSEAGFFKDAYLKRLNLYGFRTEIPRNPDADLPSAEITNLNQIGRIATQPLIKLNVKAKSNSPSTMLSQLLIYVNGVPIQSSYSGNIESTNTWQDSLSIPLSQGANKIQIAVIDNIGRRSLYASHTVFFEYPHVVKPTLHILLISPDINVKNEGRLVGVKKDFVDFAQYFSQKQDNYETIIIDTLYDALATKNNLRKSIEKLYKADINDEVIVFFAGHGAASPERTNRLKLNSLRDHFEFITLDQFDSLLIDIPARKKLLLISACNSGYSDTSKEAKGMRSLFWDLQRTSGVSVIVSSESDEVTYCARNEQSNTFFGQVLMETLNSTTSNGLSLLELGKKLTNRKLTFGKKSQSPRIFRINQDSNFIIK